jgi:HipA-like kinase
VRRADGADRVLLHLQGLRDQHRVLVMAAGDETHQGTAIWTPGVATAAQLTRIGMARDGGQVGQGGSAARYITGTDGGQWIMKAAFFGGQTHRYLYLNEALSAQVGWRLGVAVPTVAVVELDPEQLQTYSATVPESSRYVIASRRVEPAEALSPTTAAAAARSERAGIAVLDAIVWNTDRKPEHVLAHRGTDGEWHLAPIDHGHTFATADTIVGHLDPNASMPGRDALLHEGLTSADLLPWIEAAEDISRQEFYDMARSLPAPWVVEPDAPDALADALFARVRRVAEALPSSFSAA